MWNVILKRGPLHDLSWPAKTLKAALKRSSSLCSLHAVPPTKHITDEERQVITVDASDYYK